MDAFEFDTIATAFDEYIGDELTWEDLKKGFSAFVEDEQLEHQELLVAEAR